MSAKKLFNELSSRTWHEKIPLKLKNQQKEIWEFVGHDFEVKSQQRRKKVKNQIQ